MNILSSRFFDTAIPGMDEALFASPVRSAARLRKAPARAAARQAPVSLWRHTLEQSAGDRHHGIAVRICFGIIAALSVASVLYALWQTGVLMEGSSLPDAVAAFLH